MDVDVYSDDGTTKIDVKGMKANIQIILGRMRFKNPAMVTVPRKMLCQKHIQIGSKVDRHNSVQISYLEIRLYTFAFVV